jgi:pentatricopeptide repeat protein
LGHIPKSTIRFGVESYDEMVDVLQQNEKLEDALKLFDRMM